MITKQELETIRSKAPLLSEGAISPYQVSNMSKRQKAEREKNIKIRYKTEEEFKEQNKTEEQKEQEKREQEETEIKSRITQIKAQMRTIKDFPQMKSKKENSIKKTYRMYEDKLKELKEVCRR